jgi:hypothetical protein
VSDQRPAELSDPARQGVALRLQPDGAYTAQVGSVPCCRCKVVVESLYGTHDAPLCTKCIGAIVGEWCAAHVVEQRNALGLDP